MPNPKLFEQINGIAWKAVIVLLACVVPALFLPLEAPGATQKDAAIWIMDTMNGYMMGWIVQMIAMLALSIIFAGAALQIYVASPLRATIVWFFTSLSVIAFIIPKFMALWTVPMAAKALAADSAESAVAQTVLMALAPSVTFGLAPSFDYLGFWLYALIGLLLFRPLLALSVSAKIAAVAFFLFGLLFHFIFVAAYVDLLSYRDIPAAFDLAGLLLLVIASTALFFQFRAQRG